MPEREAFCAADPAMKGPKYWNYSVNEMGTEDCLAQIDHIHVTKCQELHVSAGPPPSETRRESFSVDKSPLTAKAYASNPFFPHPSPCLSCFHCLTARFSVPASQHAFAPAYLNTYLSIQGVDLVSWHGCIFRPDQKELSCTSIQHSSLFVADSANCFLPVAWHIG